MRTIVLGCTEDAEAVVQAVSKKENEYGLYIWDYYKNLGEASGDTFKMTVNDIAVEKGNGYILPACETKDKDIKIRYESEAYAQAAIKLKAYLENPHPYLLINWCIFCGMVAILLLCIIAYTLHKRNQGTSHKTIEILRLQEEKNLAARALFERQIFDYSVRFTSIDTWKDSHKLREQANIYCGNIFYRMEETYHLSEQEIKICLMVLLEFSREQMANYLYVQPNTISKAKNKIAKQLNTSSAELRTSLLDILA